MEPDKFKEKVKEAGDDVPLLLLNFESRMIYSTGNSADGNDQNEIIAEGKLYLLHIIKLSFFLGISNKEECILLTENKLDKDKQVRNQSENRKSYKKFVLFPRLKGGSYEKK